MAPTVAVPEMLKRNGLTLQDFDSTSIHEAFAPQVLCTLRAWESEEYCKNRLAWTRRWVASTRRRSPQRLLAGGGHPFAATGARLVATGPRNSRHAAVDAACCRSAPPAAWALWRSSSVELS